MNESSWSESPDHAQARHLLDAWLAAQDQFSEPDRMAVPLAAIGYALLDIGTRLAQVDGIFSAAGARVLIADLMSHPDNTDDGETP